MPTRGARVIAVHRWRRFAWIQAKRELLAVSARHQRWRSARRHQVTRRRLATSSRSRIPRRDIVRTPVAPGLRTPRNRSVRRQRLPDVAQAAIVGRRARRVAQAATVRRRAGSDCRTSRRQRLSDVAQAAIVGRRAGSDCQTSRSLRGAFDSLPVASPDLTLCHNLITSRLPPRPAFFAGPRPCPPVLRSPADPPQKHHCSCESRGDLNRLRTTDLTVSAAVISVDLARAVVVGR